MDLDRELAAEPGRARTAPAAGRRRTFEAAARRAGIGPDTLVVAYDEAAEGGAARLWWLLRHFGHERVAVLDGGLRGWREEGGPLEAGAERGRARRLRGRGRARATPPRPAAAGRAAASASCSTPERPSATAARSSRSTRWRATSRARVNLPSPSSPRTGRFLAPDELRARFEAAGAAPGRELVAYCGSGVTACVLLLAAEVAGLEPGRLYPGSWSEWSGRGLPVAAPLTRALDAQPQQRAGRRALGVGRVLAARAPPSPPAPSSTGSTLDPAEQLHPGEPASSRRRRRPRAARPRAGGAGGAGVRAPRVRFGFSSIALHTAPPATAKVTGSTRGWSSSST